LHMYILAFINIFLQSKKKRSTVKRANLIENRLLALFFNLANHFKVSFKLFYKSNANDVCTPGQMQY